MQSFKPNGFLKKLRYLVFHVNFHTPANAFKQFVKEVKEVCLQSTQARKSGENRYSFSIPLWFAPRHHLFVEKMMSYGSGVPS